jgi:hypothetical protein
MAAPLAVRRVRACTVSERRPAPALRRRNPTVSCQRGIPVGHRLLARLPGVPLAAQHRATQQLYEASSSSAATTSSASTSSELQLMSASVGVIAPRCARCACRLAHSLLGDGVVGMVRSHRNVTVSIALCSASTCSVRRTAAPRSSCTSSNRRPGVVPLGNKLDGERTVALVHGRAEAASQSQRHLVQCARAMVLAHVFRAARRVAGGAGFRSARRVAARLRLAALCLRHQARGCRAPVCCHRRCGARLPRCQS